MNATKTAKASSVSYFLWYLLLDKCKHISIQFSIQYSIWIELEQPLMDPIVGFYSWIETLKQLIAKVSKFTLAWKYIKSIGHRTFLIFPTSSVYPTFKRVHLLLTISQQIGKLELRQICDQKFSDNVHIYHRY